MSPITEVFIAATLIFGLVIAVDLMRVHVRRQAARAAETEEN